MRFTTTILLGLLLSAYGEQSAEHHGPQDVASDAAKETMNDRPASVYAAVVAKQE
jgi:hypothetical protein